MPHLTIEQAIEDIKNGKMVILVDDEDRENEGDLVIAAEKITPEAATAATQVFFWKTPISVRNSPIKPEVPGRPTLAMVKNMKISA